MQKLMPEDTAVVIFYNLNTMRQYNTSSGTKYTDRALGSESPYDTLWVDLQKMSRPLDLLLATNLHRLLPVLELLAVEVDVA